MDRQRILELIKLLKNSAATELEVEQDGLCVRIARQPPVAAEAPPAEAEPAEAVAAPAAARRGDITVHAHVVGVFYRGQGPDQPPLAEVGDEVSEGQPIGTIEALGKLIAVTAPADGVIEEFPVEDGQRVEYGTILARLRRSEGGA